jgi:hypothetical protein
MALHHPTRSTKERPAMTHATIEREALQTVLEALEGIHPGNMTPMAEEYWNKAITVAKQALAAAPVQPAIEPFALLAEWAATSRTRFVSRSHGMQTTDTVSRDALMQLICAARAAPEAPVPQPAPELKPVEFGMHDDKMMFKVGAQQFTLDYEPDTQDEFNFMRDMLVHAFSIFTPDVKTTPPAQPAVQEPKQSPPFTFRRFVAGSERAQDVAVHREVTLEAAVRVAAKICPPSESGHPTVLVYTQPAAQPAVPDAIIEAGESPDYRDGWNDCRQTMLQILKARTL